MKPLHYYLAGTGAWFLAFGIQTVMFSWLVTIVLHETPAMVGIAQMCMLVPSMLLMLFGGVVADHFGGRIVARLAQALAALPVLALGAALATDSLTFSALVGYAIAIGVIQAFVTPARDGLLNSVASGKVQRTVVLVSLVQFTSQMVGFGLAALADTAGPLPVIGLQVVVILLGAVAFHAIRLDTPPRGARLNVAGVITSITEGARTVLRSPPMRNVMIMNVAMGLLFMGSFIVTLPLLVREVFDGSAADLSLMNVFNSLGMLTTLFVLLRIGDLRRPGRALLVSQMLGAVVLAAAGMGLGFPVFLVMIYLWGTCGGVTMSMSRGIMQEQAPDTQRSRVMAFFAFTFMGAGPLGALANGLLVGRFGAETTLIIASAAMLVTAITVALTTNLWHMQRDPAAA